MPIRYEFKEKPLLIKNAKTANPQRIGEALTTIKASTADKFNSKAVLEGARNPRNYLHRFFEWDNALAAEKYRLDQARELVACIDIVDTKDPKKRAPAFVSVITRKGRAYYTVPEVLTSSSLQALMMKQIEAEMMDMEKRLMQFAELANAVRRARELIAERRARYEASGGFPPYA